MHWGKTAACRRCTPANWGIDQFEAAPSGIVTIVKVPGVSKSNYHYQSTSRPTERAPRDKAARKSLSVARVGWSGA